MRKAVEVLQQQAFVHIIQNCNYDSNTVVGVLNHTLRSLKKEHPEITKAFLRQDNAGCYHSIEMLTSCRLMEESIGIKVNLVPRLFTYARRFGKDPSWSWSRDSLKNPLLYRVGKVSNCMLPHTRDPFQMQGVRFNCYERQYKLFDLKLSIFVYFVFHFIHYC